MKNHILKPVAKSDPYKYSFIKSQWRPMIAFTYMFIVLFDFIIAPILWNMLQAGWLEIIISQWEPLTLKGGGMFHVSIGAILGVAAFTRGKEKIAEAEAIVETEKEEEVQ